MEMENMSNRSSVDEIDRISELPESVLLHILSFLDMKDVVRTSVLSKKWEFIWTSVPTLTFKYYPQEKEKLRPFVMWINKTLFQCQEDKLRKFHVGFWYMEEYAGDVDLWAKFVARNKIQDMTLDFSGYFYNLPRALCHNSSLSSLSISNCTVSLGGEICWTSLTSLSIANMKLDDNIMTKILSGTPLLQVLKISNCRSGNVLHMYSNSLRELVISTVLSHASLIEISVPNIQSLHILGKLFLGKIRICSSSLFRAKLDFRFHYYDSKKEQFWSSFMTIIKSILPVVQLEVGFYFLEALSLLGNKSLSSQFSRLTFLNFTGIMDKRVIVGIICLLKCSPNLEKLVLTKTDKFNYQCQKTTKCLKKLAGEYWESEKVIKKFELPYLKMIKFDGFRVIDEFTRVLLKLLYKYGVLHSNIVIELEDLPIIVLPKPKPCVA